MVSTLLTKKMRLLLSLSLVAVLTGTTLISSAQTPQRRRETPEERLAAETMIRASKMARQARELFRQSKIAEAESLARQATLLVDSAGLWCPEALDIPAEAAMLRKDPQSALKVLSVPQLSYRGHMTRVLALLALGRRDEAESYLLEQIGTIEDPTDWRAFSGGWDLPVDHDRTFTGIAATAYLLRMTHDAVMGYPESLDDLRSAEKFAPASVAVRLMLAEQLDKAKRYEEAQSYYEKVVASNDRRAREEANVRLDLVKRRIVARGLKTKNP